jgi:ppGpp synthetase/RelA/SpoT-type nucleotidyltranferase
MPDAAESRRWLSHQVAKYTDVFPVYRQLAAVLAQVLERAAGSAAGHAIVQTRPKAVASFADKALRKREKYGDPVNQFTDLCGGRVITRTGPEVEAVCRFLERHFEIDRENTVDTSERLRPTEFGYRSVHYIVSFRPDVDYGVPVPEQLLRHPVSPLEDPEQAARLQRRAPKAEVQVRTLLEHSYADFVHDLSYKGAFRTPDRWLRELAGAAAALERVGHTFDTVALRLGEYASAYGSYLTDQELAREIETLETILEHDRANASLAARLGKLLITAGAWDRAIAILSERVGNDTAAVPQPILRDLGVALCKRHRDRPESDAYRRGQAYLEIAAAPEHGDVDAVASLAGTWKGIDEAKVRELYRRAFAVDPADPYTLENYLEGELQRDPAVLEHMRPQIQRAMERCEAHVAVGINLPWAFYGLGRFRLLLGDPYGSLDAYARGMAASAAPFMIETARQSLERLARVGHPCDGLPWARRLLSLGLAARDPASAAAQGVREAATAGAAPFPLPVVIVAGGADPSLQERLSGYRDLLLDGFRDFRGTVISGGTTQGIPGFVGEIGAAYRGRVHTVGYLPAFVPSDATVDRDPGRYHELRYTDGHGFTALEPLQNWIDLMAAGVHPADVRVVGINGGRIAAIEYRTALALGAQVGVIAESGREVGRLVTDAYWFSAPRLLTLPGDGETLRAFLAAPGCTLPDEDRESLARAIHEAYRETRAAERSEQDLAMGGWAELPESLKESNRQQAAAIEQKLRTIGYQVQRPARGPVKVVRLSDEDIEALARMEHGRWNVERLAAGWKLSEEKDISRRLTPYLVPWSELPEPIRGRDRAAVRRIPELLAGAGFEVRKLEGAETR